MPDYNNPGTVNPANEVFGKGVSANQPGAGPIFVPSCRYQGR